MVLEGKQSPSETRARYIEDGMGTPEIGEAHFPPSRHCSILPMENGSIASMACDRSAIIYVRGDPSHEIKRRKEKSY